MAHAFESLTPDAVLDALDSVGLRGDGRLTALSSYENRVYQVQLEDGSAVVAKFYRPAALERRADPGRTRLRRRTDGRRGARRRAASCCRVPRCTTSAALPSASAPGAAARPPELDDGEVLEWIGRFLARIHTVGCQESPFSAARGWMPPALAWSPCSGCWSMTKCRWTCNRPGPRCAQALST
jgi:hypothetical protein